MSLSFLRATARTVALALLVFLASLVLPGCNRPWHWPRIVSPTPTPSPTPAPTPAPTPKPTPVFIPQKHLEVSKLFNGMEVHTKVESEPGGTATTERETPGSYALELNVKVKVPKPNSDLDSLSKLNPALPTLLPGLGEMLNKARVSDKYEALYGRKLAQLQRALPRLDLLLSRHNFFDCETILELRHPQTLRTVLLLQADMDVDTDGSDPDRLPAVDPSDPTYQPMTSYRWPKQTELVNPFLAGRQARLRAVEAELAAAKGMGAPRRQALQDAVSAAQYEVNQLKNYSFLLAATDPYVVLPGLLTEGLPTGFQPKVGDYCAVIYGNTIYPAIIGDVGPRDLVGEASLRLGKEINAEASALHRPVNTLKVTYLFFPNSADQSAGPPDLPKWRAKVEALLQEMGGYTGTLHAWTTLSRPAPTPTPTPSPTPTPAPSASPEGIPAVSLSPTPCVMPTPICLPAVSPATPTPSATPQKAASSPSPSASPQKSPGSPSK